MDRYAAIYARQSVDKRDSISIESQIELCQYELRGAASRVFKDKGYSGKNTDRPQFQEMMNLVRDGEIDRVVVYKLDRISRSVLDFSLLIQELQSHNVEFVSCTEKFDTSSPMGRAMLNICIVFAQLERETIQMRVVDAYAARSRRGFFMGGNIPYGFTTEPYVIDGKRTSRYVAVPEEAAVVQDIYRMHNIPGVSMGDIATTLHDRGILTKRGNAWNSSDVFRLIRNPAYVRADLDVYRFFSDNGVIIHNDPADFIGVNGCYMYSDNGTGKTGRSNKLEGLHLVLAPHEGIIPSDVWLTARKKHIEKSNCYQKAHKSWLLGKIRCGHCGRAITVTRSVERGHAYYNMACKLQWKPKRCEGIHGFVLKDTEDIVLNRVREHIKVLDSVDAERVDTNAGDIHEIDVRIEALQTEINQLMAKVAQANDVLLKYINERITALNDEISDCRFEKSKLKRSAKADAKQVQSVSEQLGKWDDLSFDEKRSVLDVLISEIRLTDGNIDIVWKF